MINWRKWTLSAFGRLVALRIAVRGGDKTTQEIGAMASDRVPRRTLDGEALFRAAEQDVDDEIIELPDASYERAAAEREAS